MTRLTLTARTRLNTYANVSRKQSDKETFDMSIPGVPDDYRGWQVYRVSHPQEFESPHLLASKAIDAARAKVKP